MRIRNRTVKSMTALVLCLALALGCAGGALAEGTGSFSFAVTTSAGAVIEPVSVSFTQGQTINCEFIRKEYLRTKDERYFDRLIRLLPSSYKVVKL